MFECHLIITQFVHQIKHPILKLRILSFFTKMRSFFSKLASLIKKQLLSILVLKRKSIFEQIKTDNKFCKTKQNSQIDSVFYIMSLLSEKKPLCQKLRGTNPNRPHIIRRSCTYFFSLLFSRKHNAKRVILPIMKAVFALVYCHKINSLSSRLHNLRSDFYTE